MVIPAFNAAAFVCKAIDSVLAQSYQHVEIIVLDDKSTDNTAQVVRPYIERGQIKLVQHEKNKGLSAARNTAIRSGSGQYVAFLDADDLWLPHHLTEALGLLENHPDIGVVFLDFDVVELETGLRIGSWFDERREAIALLQKQPLEDEGFLVTGGMVSALVRECIVHAQSMVVRRDLCKKATFDERLRRTEDLDWALRLAHLDKVQFAFKPRSTGIYHRHGSSLTTISEANAELIARTEWMLFREYLLWPGLSADQRSVLRSKLSAYGLALIYYDRKRKNFRSAFAHWWQSMAYGVGLVHLTEFLKLLYSLPQAYIGRGNAVDGERVCAD